MVRIAKKTDPRRLEELKRKIHDAEYLDMAVNKIAQELTQNLHEQSSLKGILHASRLHAR